MKASRGQISGYIAEQTLNKGMSKKFSREVAAYLLKEGRVGELASIIRDIRVDWLKAGIVTVTAYSKEPLKATTRERIKERAQRRFPKAKQVIVTEKRDPDIIGGVRLSLPNRQLDLGVRSKLNQFKQLITNGKE